MVFNRPNFLHRNLNGAYMKSLQIYVYPLLLMSWAALLMACGSGDNGGDGIDDGYKTATYLFYKGSFDAVDPAAPTSPIAIEQGTIPDNLVAFVPAGTYNYPSKTITDYHPYALVYAKDDGKLYRVSALKSEGAPIPAQLSSENKMPCSPSSSAMLNQMLGVDYQEPDRSQMVYLLPGSDNDCHTANDNVWMMVRLNMASVDAPLPAKQPVIPIHDISTGSLSAWLVNDGGALIRCNTDFSNCGSSLTTISSFVFDMLDVGQYHLLDLDDNTYVYDDVTNTLSPSIYPGNISRSISDGDHFYFSSVGTSIYSAPIDGSATATLLYTDADCCDIYTLALTNHNLIYTGPGGAIKSLEKIGGSPTILVNTVMPGGVFPSSIATSGAHVYYTRIDADNKPYAGMIDEDNTNQSETPNAIWIGSTLSTTQGMSSSTIDRLIRIEGSDPIAGFGGGKIDSVKASTGASDITIGKLPLDLTSIFCKGVGNNALCSAGNISPSGVSANLQYDIIYINTAAPLSLQRVTDTLANSEYPLDLAFFGFAF